MEVRGSDEEEGTGRGEEEGGVEGGSMADMLDMEEDSEGGGGAGGRVTALSGSSKCSSSPTGRERENSV